MDQPTKLERVVGIAFWGLLLLTAATWIVGTVGLVVGMAVGWL